MPTPYEKLAVLTAMKKAVAKELDAVRKECDELLLDAYEEDWVEKKALKVGGEKVGEFIVKFNPAGYDITDREAFEEFALDYGMATVKRTIRPEMTESVIRALENHFEDEVIEQAVKTEVVISKDWEKGMENIGGVVQYMDSGMNVPGVSIRPRKVAGTMVTKCQPADVIPRLNQLEGGVPALLMGGAA